MLININPLGGLGNRLFLAAHLEAFCLKHWFELYNPAMYPYDQMFPNCAPYCTADDLTRVNIEANTPGALGLTHMGFDELDYDLNPGDARIVYLIDALSRGANVYYQGWLFRGHESVRRFHPQLVEKFKPHQDVEDYAKNFVATVRASSEIVVGVYVRAGIAGGLRGDLTLDDYAASMIALRNMLSPLSATFIIVSDTTLTEADFPGLDVAMLHSPEQRAATTSATQALTTLSYCDRLLGAASTFTGWASFYGNIPYATVLPGGSLTPDQFKIW